MKALPADELTNLSIEHASHLLRRKKISPVDLTRAALARIEQSNPKLNAFITVLPERAMKEARAAEREIVRGKWRGPLHGIPVSLKDNFFTRGIRTTVGSKILADFIPDADSDVAARLAQAGAILIGKTNLHEFAYGITNENPHFGPVRNPWALDRISGGSSGGSAVAVATGMCMGSAGTDTGGSLRIPTSFCNVVGLKPTYGVVSVEGAFPLASSMDHAGPIARNVTDACILLEAMAGPYPKGATKPNYRRLRKQKLKGMRIGWPKQYFFDLVDEQVRGLLERARKTLQLLGLRVEEVSIEHVAESRDPSTAVALAEATQYHMSRGLYPARASEYGEDVRARLEMGKGVLAIDIIDAREAQHRVSSEFDAIFEVEGFDGIMAPATPFPAPKLGQTEVNIGGRKETVRAALVGVNRPADFTGHPAMSVPCGLTREKLPVGLQLIGPRWGEAKLLAIAAAFQDATDKAAIHS